LIRSQNPILFLIWIKS